MKILKKYLDNIYNDKNKSEVEKFSNYLINKVFSNKEGKELNIKYFNFCYINLLNLKIN